MGNKYQKSVTLSKKTYALAKNNATKRKQSVARFVTDCIEDNCKAEAE